MKSPASSLSVFHLCFICGCLLASGFSSNAADSPAVEQLPAGLTVVSLEARPAAVELKHKFDYRQLLITGKLQTGETVDLTRMAKASQQGSAISLSADGLVRPKEDGNGQIAYSYGGQSIEIPVTVSGV